MTIPRTMQFGYTRTTRTASSKTLINYGTVMVPGRPLQLCSPLVCFLAVVTGRTSSSLSPIFNSSWVFRT
ncbi:hypothetical protein QYF36_022127 [Acer negundo]|nr:hypothetical protein QYF36_022127 [Acer negundo]